MYLQWALGKARRGSPGPRCQNNSGSRAGYSGVREIDEDKKHPESPPFSGIAFAVPSNTVTWVVSQILTRGHVARGYMGVSGFARPVGPLFQRKLRLKHSSIFQVAETDPRGPAAAAGVEAGDFVIAVNGEQISNMDDLFRLLSVQNASGILEGAQEARITLIRNGKEVRDVGVQVDYEKAQVLQQRAASHAGRHHRSGPGGGGSGTSGGTLSGAFGCPFCSEVPILLR